MTKAIIKTLLSKVLNTPLVIEQGTSGIWTYRKWSDGTAECWGSKDISGSYSSWGNAYTFSLTGESYPSNLFIGKPKAYGQLSPSVATDGVGGICNDTSDTVAPKLLHLRPASFTGTTTFTAKWYAVGRWKNVGGVVSRLLKTLQSLTWREVIAW